MKFSTLAASASLLSSTFGATFYLTRTHYITVNGEGTVVGSTYSQPTVTAGSQDDIQVAELVQASTVDLQEAATTAAADSETSTSAAAAATSSSSSSDSSSDSGIYSEISSSGADADFAKSILDGHNEKRSAHSAPNLSWSAELYSYAQNYANQYSCGSSLVHSGGKYGENLAVGYSTGLSALDAWYSEGDNYDYSTATVLDHFTQVIWKSTTKLGCAYKQCGSGMYVICSYDPAGNFVGEGLQNLFSS